MSVVFACAASHAPGITAWTEAAPKEQADRIIGSYHKLQTMLDATRPDAVLAISVEHWANFFLSQMPTFCMGRADYYDGPVEEWLRIPKRRIPGNPQLSAELLGDCLEAGFDLSFSDELLFDHATLLPLHFLTPRSDIPVVPLIVNTLTPPMPSPKRCYALGRALGEALEKHPKRIAIVATGGLSHWPGEAKHGQINSAFDKRFLEILTSANRSQ